MSKEEPAWRTELREAIHKWDEWEIEAPLRMKGGLLDTLIPHILAAEQRGFQAGVNKTGDSVGKLRARLARVRKLSEDWAVLRTHGGAAYELRAVLDDPDKP